MKNVTSDSSIDELRLRVENALRRNIALYVLRFFPVVESLDTARLFVQTLAARTAPLVMRQIPEETKRGRPADSAVFRAERWLFDVCWEDLLSFPADTLRQRFDRIAAIVNQTAELPPYRGARSSDPRLVLLSYVSLCELFSPILKRRPGPSRLKVPAVQRGPGSGKRRQQLLQEATKKQVAEWQSARIKAANIVLSVPWWQEGQEFWFDDAELFWFDDKNNLRGLTSRQAALMVLAKNANRRTSAIWENVKEGRKLLPQKTLDAIEAVYKAHRHAPEVCEILGCPPSGQEKPSTVK